MVVAEAVAAGAEQVLQPTDITDRKTNNQSKPIYF